MAVRNATTGVCTQPQHDDVSKTPRITYRYHKDLSISSYALLGARGATMPVAHDTYHVNI